MVDRLTGHYVANRQGAESFQAFVKRVGKVEIKKEAKKNLSLLTKPLQTAPKL